MISRERCSHSSLLAPHAVMPWPPSITPIAFGLSLAALAMSRPSWKPGRRQAGLGQRAEIAAGSLDPEQVNGLAGHRVGGLALGRGVATRVVGVPRVGTETVAPGEQLGDLRVRHRCSSVSGGPARGGTAD